jgi:hypothetical protein
VPEVAIATARPSLIRLRSSVWGQGCRGETGATRFELRIRGARVSHRYRAERSAVVVDRSGRAVTVRVDGLGGLATPPPHRRRGYASRLTRESLMISQRDGYDLAMLFCAESLAPWYHSLGWYLTPADVLVSYWQSGSSPVLCPPTLRTGLYVLSSTVPPAETIASIDVAGLPW